MQQFVVPQFIDIENKIMGPLTTRQFVIIVVWAGLEFGAFKLFDMAAFAIVSFVFFLLFFPVTFLKYNGKPIHYLFISYFQNRSKAGIRVWNNRFAPSKTPESHSKREMRDARKRENMVVFAEKSTKPSKLSELTLIVDTGGVYEGEETSLEIEKAFESVKKSPLKKS